MIITLTKKEAVEQYGSSKCKEHFKKYGRFNNKNIEQSLIKTLEQHFEKVEVVKQGRSFVYQLENQRKETIEREDKRISNGAWTIPYTKNLDIIIVSALEQDDITATAQTLSMWALDFGIITPKMFSLLQSRYYEHLRENHVKDLIEKDIIKKDEDRIVDDFAFIINELTRQIAGTFKRLKKCGIIDYYPVYKGHIRSTDESIELDLSTYEKILTMRKKLLNKHHVSNWYLNTYKNAKKTIEFKKEYNKKLAQIEDSNGNVLGLDYYYIAYDVILKENEKAIIAYLKKYNQEAIELFKRDEDIFLLINKAEFYRERSDYVVKKAQKNVDKFFEPKVIKKAHPELGGRNLIRRPLPGDFKYDEEYYNLYFNQLYVKRISELQEYYTYGWRMNENEGIKKDITTIVG
ncbi:UNVERIFIED_ORG: hypothetical protein ABRZ91_001788 [Heyndrickxia coagulans]